MKVWLDDERPAPPGWVHVRTVSEAIDVLIENEGSIEEMSLDHDLGDPEHGEGYDVLEWIERRVHRSAYKPPVVLHVHSANPPARKRMEAAVAAIEKAVREA